MASRRRAPTGHKVRLTEEPVHGGGIRITAKAARDAQPDLLSELAEGVPA